MTFVIVGLACALARVGCMAGRTADAQSKAVAAEAARKLRRLTICLSLRLTEMERGGRCATQTPPLPPFDDRRKQGAAAGYRYPDSAMAYRRVSGSDPLRACRLSGAPSTAAVENSPVRSH